MERGFGNGACWNVGMLDVGRSLEFFYVLFLPSPRWLTSPPLPSNHDPPQDDNAVKEHLLPYLATLKADIVSFRTLVKEMGL